MEAVKKFQFFQKKIGFVSALNKPYILCRFFFGSHILGLTSMKKGMNF